MRLSEDEQYKIKQAFSEVFEHGRIYLFGSRVDDSQKGGDIDLYLDLEKNFKDVRYKKNSFLIKLDDYLGEQKIDVIISKDKTRLIEQEALKWGIEL